MNFLIIKEMTNEQALEKLQSHEQIQKFKTFMDGVDLKYHTITLVGGAVIDILEDKTPKDYDFFTTLSKQSLVNSGWEFLYSTSTADTYRFDGVICQVLKKLVEDFEFTISQSRVSITKEKIHSVNVDLVSFNSKKLIPVGFERKHVVECLLRIPHYRKKGYSISDETYLSLVRAATKTNKSIIS